MTNDQFEILAQMIKGLHDHMDERFEQIDQHFAQVDARIDTLEERLETRISTVAAAVKALEAEVHNVTGFIPEIRNHGERLVTIETKLGITPKPIKY